MSTETEENEPESPTPSPAGGKRKVIKKRVGRKHRQEELEQPDEFMEVGGTFVDWIVERRRIVGPLLGGAFAVLLIGALVQSSGQGNREDAAAALAVAAEKMPEVENPFGSQFSLSGLTEEPEDNTERDQEIRDSAALLSAVAKEFDGTPQAGIANIKAGAALSRIPDYEAALAHFVAAENADGVVGQTATSGRAYTLASLARYDEALPLFDSLVEKTSGAMKQQLLVDRAKVYETKGDTARAQELFRAFEAEYPDSPLLTDVKSRIQSN